METETRKAYADTPQRAMVVSNPAAGGVTDRLVEAVAERVGRNVHDVAVVYTADPDETGVEPVAAALADHNGEGPVDLVVAVGGDGTVRYAAESIARATGRWPGGGGDDPRPALAIVPRGTGNSAYQALWGELGWETALDAALGADGSCEIHLLDLIRVEGADEASVLGVNTGLVAEVAAAVERTKEDGTEDDVGPERYATAFVEVVQGFEPFPCVVTVDGEVIHEGPTTFVSIGGVRSFGGGSFKLLPRSVLDDGLLDVCAVAGTTDSDLFQEVAQQVLAGEHLGHPRVAYAQGREVTIERTDGAPLAVEHDGDPHPAGSKLTLAVVPRAVPTLALPGHG
jgi:diacylglycerol kinase (ATP)